VTGGTVGPPIPPQAAKHMTDDQWLRAMAKHADRTDWTTLTGGARELAQVLKDQTAADPERFARLALRLTRETHLAYADGILLGLGETGEPVDPALVFQAIRHLAGLGHPGNDRWLGWALRPHYAADVPDDIIQVLLDRALHSPDPAEDQGFAEDDDNASTRRDTMLNRGINTAPGHLAEALGDLLVHDADGHRTALIVRHSASWRPIRRCQSGPASRTLSLPVCGMPARTPSRRSRYSSRRTTVC
jgi:hypothetical protein